jgi:hypothetical protein
LATAQEFSRYTALQADRSEQEDAKSVRPWQNRRPAGSDCLVVDSAEEPSFVIGLKTAADTTVSNRLRKFLPAAAHSLEH